MDSAPLARTSSAFPFRAVAIVFWVLLALGFGLGIVVYKKYVAYLPTVAQHVPADATLAARIDLTHVMLYAPYRSSILPLANGGGHAGSARAERLAAQGVRLGADVRELLLALGPAPGDWVVVAGGQLPRQGLAETVSAVLREESRTAEARPGGCFFVSPAGPWFAQASDGAFVLASSESRLRQALPVRGTDAELGKLAGGVFLSQSWLGAPFKSLRASLRAGSVVAVDVHVEFTERASGEAALRSLLNTLAKLDPVLTVPIQGVRLRPTATGADFRLDLPQGAVERVAAMAAERVSERFSAAP